MQQAGWILIVIAVILWLIYSTLKECLQELKNVRQQISFAQGDMKEQTELLRYEIGEVDKKLVVVEETASAYYDENIKPRRRY